MSLMIPVASMAPKERFDKLADDWQAETAMMSSPIGRVSHRAYQQIVGMGPTAVPLIMERWRTYDDDWGWALAAIVGEDAAAGTITYGDMKAKWLEWYEQSAYETCSFERCKHLRKFHGETPNYQTGCLVEGCPCAVYSSPESHGNSAKWFATEGYAFDSGGMMPSVTESRPVVTTVNEVANRIHRGQRGRDEDHSPLHSCVCSHIAMGLLGITNTEDK
jgi:hypothetical protein